MKNYRTDIIVEIDQRFFEVYFFTADGLEYEMTKDGYFSFPGMIILEDITIEIIKTAVRQLHNKHYFTRLKSSDSLDESNRFMNSWYTNELGTFDESTRVSLKL